MAQSSGGYAAVTAAPNRDFGLQQSPVCLGNLMEVSLLFPKFSSLSRGYVTWGLPGPLKIDTKEGEGILMAQGFIKNFPHSYPSIIKIIAFFLGATCLQILISLAE